MLPRGFGNNRQNNASHIVSLISDDDELSSQRKNSKAKTIVNKLSHVVIFCKCAYYILYVGSPTYYR
jgi:hypothetical protein